MDENLFEDERCEHGILFDFECDACEKENNEFFTDLFRQMGNGDIALGKRLVLAALTRRKTL